MKSRRQAFILHYLGDAKGNGAEACRLAGYAPKNARTQASQLLADPDVRQAIDAHQKQLATQAGYTAERVVSELAKVADVEVSKVSAGDKIKALELLGKAHGLFKDAKGDSRISVTIGFLTQPQTGERRIGQGRSELASLEPVAD